MTTSLDDYFLDLQNSVRTRAAADAGFTQSAFMHEIAERLSLVDEIGALTVNSLETTGARNKRISIDGCDLDDEENQVVVAIADFRQGDAVETVTTTEAKKHFAALEGFVKSALDGTFPEWVDPSSPAFEDAQSINERRAGNKLDKIRLYLLTNAKLSDSIKSFPSERLDGIEFEYHIWGIERFHRVETSELGREEIDIDVTEWVPSGIPALPASTEGTDVETYLLVAPGEVVADVYERFGSRILESNVRAFLSNRGKVNKGIQGTLIQTPELFLAFNNGVTATASAIKRTDVDGVTRIAAIRDLQIVNGGQTTASLYYARRNEKVDLGGVFVQMKLIVVDDSMAKELVPRISRYANTQNKVNESDFFSNHPFHQRMEEKSRQLRTPVRAGEHHETKWFYERIRGQYLSEKNKRSTRDARKFEAEYPKDQVIEKTLAARYLVTWDQRPHIVSSGLQKNFVTFADWVSTAWTKSDLAFNDYYFRSLVGKTLMFKEVESAVSNSAWYRAATGYRLNIVTYSIARFALAVQEYRPGAEFDFDTIWNLQTIPTEVVDEIASFAEMVRDSLVDPKRPVTNVTEWAKRQACWDVVKSLPFDYPEELSPLLRSTEDLAESRRSGRQAQKQDNEINAQVEVLNLGAPYWVNLRDFGKKMSKLTETEQGILRYATGERGTLPSERQCKRLLEIRRKMVDIGFDGR